MKMMRIFKNFGVENHVPVMYKAPCGINIVIHCFNCKIWLILSGGILISIS